jgi:hypothetical protein
LLEYSNGEGGWTTIPDCSTPSAGCTVEIDFAPSGGLTEQTIQLRLTNNGGSALTITKSKPLEGAELGATNPDTDFSEGLAIVPGKYALASVFFTPGASILNANPIFYSGTWTLNTDDLTFGVHVLNFTGAVISTQTGPKNSAGTSLYKYLGCYQDYINNVRLEPTQEYNNVNNTNGLCQTQGLALGLIFAGTEYMTQCWLGSIIPPTTALVADSFCSYNCAGDSTQVCGGPGGYLSIYYDSSRYFPANDTIIGASGAGPSIPKTVGAYNYAGCCKLTLWSPAAQANITIDLDSVSARVLDTEATAGATVTLETCATFCAAYSFFGTEYGTLISPHP